MGKRLVANDIAGVGHLFQELIQPPEGPDNGAFVRVSHFAQGGECGPVAPLVTDLHELFFDGVQVLVLNREIITS